MVEESIQPQTQESNLIPEIPELSAEQIKINELNNTIKNFNFFSNQANFNSIVYQFMNTIIEELRKIEGKLNAKN